MRQNKRLMKARAAVLLDHFHLSIEQFGRLTDRQIDELYFHARGDDGAIKAPQEAGGAPEAPASYEADLAQLEMLRAMRVIPEDNYARCVEELKAKYGR